MKCLNLIGFSLITIEFPDQDKFLGWSEAAAGIGLAVGPVLASFIFNFTSYTVTFLIFGIMISIGSIVLIIYLPKTDGSKNDNQTSVSNDGNELVI